MKKSFGPYNLPYAPVAIVNYRLVLAGGKVPQFKAGDDPAKYAGLLLHGVVDDSLMEVQQIKTAYASIPFETCSDQHFLSLCEYWAKSMLTSVDLIKVLLTKHLMTGLNLQDAPSAEASLQFVAANLKYILQWMLAFENEVCRLRPSNLELRRCNDLLNGISLPIFEEMQLMAKTLHDGSEAATATLRINLQLPPVTDAIEEILKNHHPAIRIQSNYRPMPVFDSLVTGATYWYLTSRFRNIFN
jgi:hypothetical protein